MFSSRIDFISGMKFSSKLEFGVFASKTYFRVNVSKHKSFYLQLTFDQNLFIQNQFRLVIKKNNQFGYGRTKHIDLGFGYPKKTEMDGNAKKLAFHYLDIFVVEPKKNIPCHNLRLWKTRNDHRMLNRMEYNLFHHISILLCLVFTNNQT